MQNNREFKFRCWDKLKNKMFYDVWVVNGKSYHSAYISDFTDREIKKGILMQFISLKDKNDKEIYEGDIVKYQYNSSEHEIENDIGEVYFENGIFLFDKKMKFATNDCNFREESLEIVGNIYENPELLNNT